MINCDFHSSSQKQCCSFLDTFCCKFLIDIDSLLKVFIFIYFWLLWVFVALYGLSLVVVSEGYTLWSAGFSLWQCLVVEHAL